MDNVKIGRRIREARARRGLTQADVAARLSLDKTAVSKLENGTRALSSGELAELADLLGMSMRDLLGTRQPLGALAFAHRLGDADENSSSTQQARSVLVDLLELQALLDELEVPTTRPSAHDLPQPPNTTSLVTAGGRMAAQIRGSLQLGDQPIHDLIDLLEHFGVEVVGRPLGHGDDVLAGMCTDHDSLRAALVNTDQWGTRQRFTLAHEFGHILFRDARDEGGWHSDTAAQLGGDGVDPVEVRANAFAAELLLPRSAAAHVVEEAGGLDEDVFTDLLFDYGVSVPTLTYRLLDAGVLTREGVPGWIDLAPGRLAFAHNRRQDHLSHERARGAVRAPSRLYERAMMAYRSGRLGIRPLAALTGDDPDELRAQLSELGLGPDLSGDTDVLDLL